MAVSLVLLLLVVMVVVVVVVTTPHHLDYRVGFGTPTHILRFSVMKLYIHAMIHCPPPYTSTT